MNVIVVGADLLGSRSATIVREGIDSGAVRVVGVATGSSPLPLYSDLARSRPRRIDDVELFALDEYVGLTAQHPQSYRSFLDRELVRPLAIDPARLHVLDGVADDPELECRDFERAIDDAGGIDLQILGIGSNGHVGFNEPGSSPSSRTRMAPLTEQTRADNARFFDSPADVPTHCLTQGIATILSARSILLIASGEAKAQAIARAVHAPRDPSTPASYLRDHPNVTLLLDPAAASMLTPEGALR